MKTLIAVLAAVWCILPSSASACLNDREIARAENEFKSSYIQEAKADKPRISPGAWAAMAGGVFFLAATPLLLKKR